MCACKSVCVYECYYMYVWRWGQASSFFLPPWFFIDDSRIVEGHGIETVDQVLCGVI